MAASSTTSSETPSGTQLVEKTISEYKQAIAQWVSTLASGVSESQIAAVLQPSATKDCDWTLPIPALNKFAKQAGQPNKLATDWVAEFSTEKTQGLIRSANANGVFIHFHINPERLKAQTLQGVFLDKERYGNSLEGNGQTAIVEYSSPNMAKPFHVGHLRSTIIGNFLRNLYDRLGYKTVAMNYLGDWGKQYGMLAVGFAKYGDSAKLETDPIRHLYDVYVAINRDAKEEGSTVHNEAREHFRRMEAGDPEALAIWQRFRDLSIEKSKKIYARMGVHFDVYSGESFYPVSKQKAIIDRLESLNLLETDETGARLIDLTKYKLGKVVFQKSDGSLLYISRDIAAAIDRHETYNFSKMLYVVATQQQLHFQQLFKILELMGFEKVKDCTHVSFGLVKGMSTRSGTAVFLEDILDTARDTNMEIMKKNDVKFSEVEDPLYTADVIGNSAVVIQDLVAKRIKDYTFAWERCLQSTGDTGAYLQFAHVRIASIMRKAKIPVEYDGVDLSLLSEPECATLVSWIADYPGILKRAAELLEPSHVVQYTLKLTHLISTMLQHMHVKNAPTPEIGKARMLMFWAAKQTLENAIRLLSLTPLERM